MILIRFNRDGSKRLSDLTNLFEGRTVLLIGGSPSIKEQQIERIEQRGILSAAINNAAKHVKTTLWFSGDNPKCYEPQIIFDPTIIKFAPVSNHSIKIDTTPYFHLSNLYFYMPLDDVPWNEFFAPRKEVPWFKNTLFVAINILYNLGIRRIILCGSDFAFSKDGKVYAHDTPLNEKEKSWNTAIYNYQVQELRALRPMFEKYKLELLDASKYSRLSSVYKHIDLDTAIDLCLKDFPKQPKKDSDLLHCSRFSGKYKPLSDLKEIII